MLWLLSTQFLEKRHRRWMIFIVLLGECAAAHLQQGIVPERIWRRIGSSDTATAAQLLVMSDRKGGLLQATASRKILETAFEGAPPIAEKEAEAAAILGARPDALLRNLHVKGLTASALFPEGCDVVQGGDDRRRRVITSGATNSADDATGCGNLCSAAGGCNAWLWCDDTKGCQTESNIDLPEKGCHLESQQPAFAIEPPMTWQLSKFAAGWQGAVGSPKPVPAEQQVAVLAPFTTEACRLPFGDIALKQAFLNKRDWAMLHNHQFRSYAVRQDPALPGTWYRLAILKQVHAKTRHYFFLPSRNWFKALEEIPAATAGWLLMADQDVMVDDMAFELPLLQYPEQQDLVLYGSKKLLSSDTYQNLLSVEHKDRQQGLDTGVLLMRNTDWSLSFINEALSYLQDSDKQARMRVELKTWEPLLWEQNAVALLLQSSDNLEHTVFEKEFCINCAWVHGQQGKLPFMKRFSECAFCTGARNSREEIYECTIEAAAQFAHSHKIMYALTGCGQTHGRSDLIASTDPNPRVGALTGDALGGDHQLSIALSFLQTNFITMVFIAVFLLGILHKRKKRRHSSE